MAAGARAFGLVYLALTLGRLVRVGYPPPPLLAGLMVPASYGLMATGRSREFGGGHLFGLGGVTPLFGLMRGQRTLLVWGGITPLCGLMRL